MWSQIIGSVGVGLLLLAFVLNLARKVSEHDRIYLILNIVGCALAAWYAWVGQQVPFIVLEGVWGLVALARLLSLIRQKKTPAEAGVR
jgi:hypothetical protein